MKTPLSPLDIEVLLWYFYKTEPHENIAAPAVKESILMWTRSGMLKPLHTYVCPEGMYCTTEKGDAMVKALCNTPEPPYILESRCTPEPQRLKRSRRNWKRVLTDHEWRHLVGLHLTTFRSVNTMLRQQKKIAKLRGRASVCMVCERIGVKLTEGGFIE